VVLASKDLPLGTVLAEEDLRVVEWPAGAMPVGFANSREELVGEALIGDVLANEPILAANLADSGLRGLIPLIEPGMRAMSVWVDNVVSVAGFVTPQTRVDVILVMTPPGGSEEISKVILQNIQVLAVDQIIQETEEGEAIVVSVVSVLVTPEQAEILTLASQAGHIRMVLRHTLDEETVETLGVRRSRLFSGVGGMGRPAPRSGAAPLTTRESIIEIYRGGVRTTISYDHP
jgi:pilus assembly protein CpaB